MHQGKGVQEFEEFKEFQEKEQGARIRESGGVWYDHTEEVIPPRRFVQPSVSGSRMAPPVLELLYSLNF
jgi:hypothetical protein